MHRPKNPRPPGTPPSGPSPVRSSQDTARITISMPRAFHERMKAYAIVHKTDVSKMARIAVHEKYFSDDPRIDPLTLEERVEVLELQLKSLLDKSGHW